VSVVVIPVSFSVKSALRQFGCESIPDTVIATSTQKSHETSPGMRIETPMSM
jgi:hypothetical protein